MQLIWYTLMNWFKILEILCVTMKCGVSSSPSSTFYVFILENIHYWFPPPLHFRPRARFFRNDINLLYDTLVTSSPGLKRSDLVLVQLICSRGNSSRTHFRWMACWWLRSPSPSLSSWSVGPSTRTSACRALVQGWGPASCADSSPRCSLRLVLRGGSDGSEMGSDSKREEEFHTQLVGVCWSDSATNWVCFSKHLRRKNDGES